jgi:translation initiation factor 4G
MSVCKERPATLPPLDAIGLEPVDHTHAMSRGGSGHRPSGALPPLRQASVGLGLEALVEGDP